MEITIINAEINETTVDIVAECDSHTVEHYSPCVSGWSRGGDCMVGDQVDTQLVVESLVAAADIMGCDEDGNEIVVAPRGTDLMPYYRASESLREQVEEAVIEYWQTV